MEADAKQSSTSDRTVKYQFLFYDSEVNKIIVKDQLMLIQFSAANVVRLDDEAIGYLSNVELQMLSEQLPSVDAACFGRLKDGQLVIEEDRFRAVELPCERETATRLFLSFSNGAELQCVGHQLKVQAQATSKFTESSNC